NELKEYYMDGLVKREVIGDDSLAWWVSQANPTRNSFPTLTKMAFDLFSMPAMEPLSSNDDDDSNLTTKVVNIASLGSTIGPQGADTLSPYRAIGKLHNLVNYISRSGQRIIAFDKAQQEVADELVTFFIRLKKDTGLYQTSRDPGP
ncbi:hypothetical protein B0A49_12608, partial [Cryomyces minteri]